MVYTGDDERFDYLYKFVSEKRYSGDSWPDNLGLLDSGVLDVAKFNAATSLFIKSTLV